MSVVRGQPAGDEEHPEAVVVAVAEAAGDAAVELDEAVDGFGAAVAGAVGVEVAEERRCATASGCGRGGRLRGSGRLAGSSRICLGEASSGGVAVLVEGRRGPVGRSGQATSTSTCCFAGGERRVQAGLAAFR